MIIGKPHKHSHKGQIAKRISSILRGFVAILVFLGLVTATVIRPAYACHSCTCVIQQHEKTRDVINQEHDKTRKHITNEFKKMQLWITDDFYRGYILPAWMMLTEQLSAVGLQQMLILGTFFDAKQQLEVQQLFQKLEAQAHKDYHPSLDLCYIGTTVRSMSASERKGQLTAIIMAQRSQDRQLGNLNSAAAEGVKEDRESRIEQYIKYFCDKADDNGQLENMCVDSTAKPDNINKDIDYTRTVENTRTLDVDFSDTTLTDDERTVMAMGAYLFGHEVFDRAKMERLRTKDGHDDLLNMRSVAAKRSVAENSFDMIVGMRARGGENAPDTFMAALLKDMGVNDNDAKEIVGTDPSYYAQMEWMARKIYQRPEFYTNLYGKPANVARKNVAMQAIGLMVDRDAYRSDIRSEALLSLWLELEVSKYQDDVQNRIRLLNADLKETAP